MERIWAKEALLPEGWVAEVAVTLDADGRIASVAPNSTAADAQRVDLLMPAPTNLHSHSFQRALAGLTEARGPRGTPDSFWSWRRLMYRFLPRLTPELVEAIAAQAFVEMAEAGYAAVAEFHYVHHQPDGTAYADPAEMTGRIVAAAVEVGLGLTALPVLYTQGGADGRRLDVGQRRFGSDVAGFTQLLDAARTHCDAAPADYGTGVAPHSLRAVSPKELRDVVRLAGNRPIHIHIAEQAAEVTEVAAALGARPVEWLCDRMPLDAQWCLIHATQMRASETERVARTGATVGLCPITEANLGDGIFPATAFVGKGGRFGVGTDSNVHIAYFEELCLLEYGQRLRDHSRAALADEDGSPGRLLVEQSLAAGASAAGRETGQIAVGHWGDLLGLTTQTAWLCDRTGDGALDTLIFGGRGRDSITDLWSAGRRIVRDGQHPKRATIAARFRDAMTTLGAAL